jgi:hypothetical protein
MSKILDRPINNVMIGLRVIDFARFVFLPLHRHRVAFFLAGGG